MKYYMDSVFETAFVTRYAFYNLSKIINLDMKPRWKIAILLLE